jgi:integrase/recombinase XerD
MSRAKQFTFRPRGREHIELFRAGRVAGSMDLIYWHPLALTRHRNAPLLKEREEFLLHLLRRGSNRNRVQCVSAMLLRAIKALGLKVLRPLSPEDVDNAVRQIWGQKVKSGSDFPGSHGACALRNQFTMFLRFHGKFKTRRLPRQPFAKELDNFSEFNRSRNLLPGSVESHRLKTRIFLQWYSLGGKGLSKLSIHHVDSFIAKKRADGWSSATFSSAIQALRVFVRYGHSQGWCPDIADGIKAPYHSRLGVPPQGRAWTEVVQLLEATNGKDLASVRAKAAFSLIATYGLRCSEAARLFLSDFDWKKQTVIMRRSKRGRKQILPFSSDVRQAVLNYIRIRPRCSFRHLFLSLRPPYRPIGKSSFYCLTSRRLKKLGVISGCLGPHSIRHARAMQLLRGGSTVKEIGDFLGQRHPESPLFYAKFDVELLRAVADFKLEGLI